MKTCAVLFKNCTGHLWYDRLGRVVLVQNALQRPLLYTYNIYDALSRVIEVGQVSTVPQNLPSCFHCVGCTIAYGVLPVLPDTFSRKDDELQNFINTGTRTQVTHTYYDSVTYSNIPLVQQNLRKRIASITYEERNDNNIRTYDNAVHYTYDIGGNIASMLIDVPHDSIVKQRYKRVNYYYDLASGKVTEMVYEPDSIDQFIHSYEYDADNRLTDVLTSHDSLFWEHDAGYEYYDDGPIAREVIGRRSVQGIDFAYTINGWLKSINSGINNPSYDMGGDGDVQGFNNTVARDAYGFVLNYFNGDYRSIGASNFQPSGLPATSLYNSNVSGATYSISKLSPKTIGYTYGYDQLNRIISEKAFKGVDTVNNLWTASDSINDFKEKISYDENGNILTYIRHGNSAVGPMQMDSLTYHYTKGRNQLTNTNDAISSTNYTIDIDNEPSKRNYQYNGIGQLAKDSAGGIDTITWTIYGTVREVKKHNGDSIAFFYNPLMNLIEKRYYPYSNTADTTIYTNVANGDVLAIYDRKKDTVRLTEWEIYGGKRLGVLDTILLMKKPVLGSGSIDSLTISYLEGQKQYELTNHLENVLVTISDKKVPVDTVSTDTLAKYYLPVVISSQDYYPFGMQQPGRTYLLNGDSAYKFGFNGRLKLNEIYGTSNMYDFTARLYDPRIAKWLTLDPKASKYPNYSPYSYGLDNPIVTNDKDGKDPLTDALVEVGRWATSRQVISSLDLKGTVGNVVNFSAGMANVLFSAIPTQKDAQNAAIHAAQNIFTTATTLIKGDVPEIKTPEDMINAVLQFNPGLKDAADAIKMVSSVAKEAFAGDAYAQGQIVGLAVALVLAGEDAEVMEENMSAAMKTMEEVEGDGIIYKRTDPSTGEDYIGKSKDEQSFVQRKKVHDKTKGVKHDYTVLEKPKTENLDVAEETHIRKNGGPKKQGGKLANKRYQMNDKRYKEAGGEEPKPTK
ncbi:MAG TPA: RHS repeat-associated core domain-containing protein [Bacteroidia bacterium]|nr:RHS repeat-associated core domain-containing protein [Bacteroidia bacterium]